MSVEWNAVLPALLALPWRRMVQPLGGHVMDSQNQLLSALYTVEMPCKKKPYRSRVRLLAYGHFSPYCDSGLEQIFENVVKHTSPISNCQGKNYE